MDRQCCERFAIPVRYKLDARTIDTGAFLSAFETWCKGDQRRTYIEETIERVKMFRKVVMNQASHSAPPTIAHSEVNGAIYAVEALYKLVDPKTEIDKSAIVEARDLALRTSPDEWIASLGFMRGAFAVSLRSLCKRKRISVPFDD